MGFSTRFSTRVCMAPATMRASAPCASAACSFSWPLGLPCCEGAALGVLLGPRGLRMAVAKQGRWGAGGSGGWAAAADPACMHGGGRGVAGGSLRSGARLIQGEHPGERQGPKERALRPLRLGSTCEVQAARATRTSSGDGPPSAASSVSLCRMRDRDARAIRGACFNWRCLALIERIWGDRFSGSPEPLSLLTSCLPSHLEQQLEERGLLHTSPR
jgi:hypothetical protein